MARLVSELGVATTEQRRNGRGGRRGRAARPGVTATVLALTAALLSPVAAYAGSLAPQDAGRAASQGRTATGSVTGTATNGPLQLSLATPEPIEFPETGETEIVFTFTLGNTGAVPLTVTGIDLPSDASVYEWGCDGVTVAAGGTAECSVSFSDVADPGTAVTLPITVTAAAGSVTYAATVSAHLVAVDVAPALWLDVYADQVDVVSGTTVTFTAHQYGGRYSGDAQTTLTSLTSANFGDLMDATNPRLLSTTCATPAAFAECSYSAVVTAPAGTFTETVTAVLTDDEGSTGTRTESIDLRVLAKAVRVPRTAKDWAAEGEWPSFVVKSRSVTKASRVATVFGTPAGCATLARATLSRVLTMRPSGACAVKTRLARAATTALLNEARYGSGYLGAVTVGDVARRTESAYRSNRPRTMLDLAVHFEKCNR